MSIRTLVEGWITGRPVAGHAAIGVAEAVEAVPAALAGLRTGDVLLGPRAAIAGRSGPAGVVLVSYDGSLREIGDEFTVTGRTVEVQDYAAAGFIEVVGPMVVRLGDAGGWAAFLDDADEARASGRFPAALLHPNVLLGERWALRAHAVGVERPRRPVHAHDGSCRTAPEGVRADDGAGASALVQAFGGVVAPAVLTSDAAARPWLGRYAAALDLLRRTRRGPVADVIGFGASLLEPAEADRVAAVDAPFLSRVGGDWLLEETVHGRRYRLGVEAATIVEALQTSSTHERARDRAAAALAIPAAAARSLVAEVSLRLTSTTGSTVAA